MFDILMYLSEIYIHNEPEMRVNQEQLTNELAQAGFHLDDIYNALNRLEKLVDLQEGENAPYFMDADPLAMRVYTEEEALRLDANCRGFLLFLEQIQVLNLEAR